MEAIETDADRIEVVLCEITHRLQRVCESDDQIASGVARELLNNHLVMLGHLIALLTQDSVRAVLADSTPG